MATGDGEKYCLRWNDFTSNLSSAFNELRDDEDFFDITLITEESEIRCHKLILGACSPHFRNIIRRLSAVQNPAIYLRGVRHEDIKNILEFMYLGMVNVAQEDLDSFLSVAQDLCIKGLTQDGGSGGQQQQTSNASSSSHTPTSGTPLKHATPPPAKRAKLKSNGDNFKSSAPVPKKEPKLDPDIVQIDETSTDQADIEGYEDYYEAGPSDPGDDGKGNDDGLVPTKNGGVMCVKCGKVLSALSSGRRHIRETHQLQVKAQCQICKRFYKNVRQRNEHLNTAHGISARQMRNVIKVPEVEGIEGIATDDVPLKMEFEPELEDYLT